MNQAITRDKAHFLYNQDGHQCIQFSDLVVGEGIQSNQFLIIDNNRAALIDRYGDIAGRSAQCVSDLLGEPRRIQTQSGAGPCWLQNGVRHLHATLVLPESASCARLFGTLRPLWRQDSHAPFETA